MKTHQGLRVAVDFGAPLSMAVAFAITRNMQTATAVLVGASILALLVGWLVEKRLAFLPLIAGGFAVVFGALTLIFKDSSFVKMKLTFVNLLFAGLCLVVAFLRPHWVKLLLGDVVQLPDTAVRTLMLRYAAFFVCVAGINEYVWRTQTDGFWIGFRIALLPLALVFSFTQAPLLMKYMKQPGADATPEPPDAGF